MRLLLIDDNECSGNELDKLCQLIKKTLKPTMACRLSEYKLEIEINEYALISILSKQLKEVKIK